MKSSSPLASGNLSLEKGLALLNRILADRGQTNLTELAADLAVPRSTLYRLTSILARAGLITRVERGCYDIGLPLVEKVNGTTGAGHLARLCRPSLQALAKTCGATAHLGVMDNDMVTYLVKESAGPNPAAPFTRENAQLEAYCSGIGKVLLAWLPEAERNLYLAGGPFVALTRRTITDPLILKDCLKFVRAERFARDDSEIADDLYCLAVPLWIDPEPMTAAISLSFTRREGQQVDDATYLTKLRACAAKLSAKLGKSN